MITKLQITSKLHYHRKCDFQLSKRKLGYRTLLPLTAPIALTRPSLTSLDLLSTSLDNSGLCWTVFAHNRDTAVPAEGNGDLQTLICVLVVRPRRCPTTHIVESCPLTKLNGGLSRLHSADEDAVSWLTSYGSWHTYEKSGMDVFTHMCGQKADTLSNYYDNVQPYDKRRFSFCQMWHDFRLFYFGNYDKFKFLTFVR